MINANVNDLVILESMMYLPIYLDVAMNALLHKDKSINIPKVQMPVSNQFFNFGISKFRYCIKIRPILKEMFITKYQR